MATTARDFSNGVILCELVKLLKNGPIRYDSKDLAEADTQPCPKNIRIALNELKSYAIGKLPKEIATLRPQDIYRSEEQLYSLLAFLKYSFYCKNHPASTERKQSVQKNIPIKSAAHSKNNIKGVKKRSKSELGKYEEPKDAKHKQADSPKQKKDRTDIRIKLKLLSWLERLNVIKQGSIEPEDLPERFRDGTLLFSLILTLEGVFSPVTLEAVPAAGSQQEAQRQSRRCDEREKVS